MFEPGSVVAGYRIERALGAGGMGAVYLAQNPTLPRLDAVKVLSAELSRSPEFRARFVREADVASSLSHPNIVAIHRRGETEQGQLWIAMQYVEGIDADAAVRERVMPPARAVFVVAEVAKALDYAHSRNVVHRDVKPANFLLSTEGGVERVLLGDFGIARALDDIGLTMTGAVLATVAYAAPEVLSGMPFDGRADLYSLGCTLYRLLTGRTPFSEANGVPAVMMAHLEQPPPRVTDMVPGLPPALDWVIATAMAKDPAQRFQSGADLAAAATAALAGQSPMAAVRVLPAPAPRTAMAPVTVQPVPARTRSRRWLVALVVAVAVLAAGTVTAVVASSGDATIEAPEPSTAAPADPDPVPVARLKRLLLTTDEVDAVMGVAMTAEPERSQMSGDARYLEQKECAGMWGPGQQLAYAGSGYLGTAQQGFSAPGTGSPPLHYQTYQAVVGFPSEDAADEYFAAQTEQWNQCANRTMTFAPQGPPIAIVQGGVTDTGNLTITSIQTLENAQGWLCARALAVRRNVTVDTFACSPDNAVDQAVAVVDQIAAKITDA